MPELGDTLVRDEKTWAVAAVTESVDDHRVIFMALPPEVEKESSHVALPPDVERESSHLKDSARWPRWR